MSFFHNILDAIRFMSLPSVKKQITFYSEGKDNWPHLSSLIRAILENTNFNVCYVSSIKDDPGHLLIHPNLKTFTIGSSYVRDHFFQNLDTNIMIMTMPDLDNLRIKRSVNKVHYIYVQHSLVSLHMVYREGAFDNYDTICATGPHHVKEIRAIEAKKRLPKKNIVKLRYSKFDFLTANHHFSSDPKEIDKKESKKIIIAPSWGPEGIIESGLGESLVSQLLDLGHEVILRPHPQTFKFAKEKIDAINSKHKSNNRFSFESDVVDNQSFYNSDIMVSDWSGAALEYSFAMEKPVIFCDVPKKVNNKNYKEIDIEPIEISIRSKIGVIWDGMSPISESIKACLKKNKKKLSNLSQQYCFNKSSSNMIFVEFCKSLL